MSDPVGVDTTPAHLLPPRVKHTVQMHRCYIAPPLPSYISPPTKDETSDPVLAGFLDDGYDIECSHVVNGAIVYTLVKRERIDE